MPEWLSVARGGAPAWPQRHLERRERTLGRVLGRVRLWGTVVECSQGWRASHAYPERLYVSSGAHEVQLLDGEAA